MSNAGICAQGRGNYKETKTTFLILKKAITMTVIVFFGVYR